MKPLTNRPLPLICLVLVAIACVNGPQDRKETNAPVDLTETSAPSSSPQEKPMPTESPAPQGPFRILDLIGKDKKFLEKALGKPTDCHPMRPNSKIGKESCDYKVRGLKDFWIGLEDGKLMYLRFESETPFSNVLDFGKAYGLELSDATPSFANDFNITYKGRMFDLDWLDFTFSSKGKGQWAYFQITSKYYP